MITLSSGVGLVRRERCGHLSVCVAGGRTGWPGDRAGRLGQPLEHVPRPDRAGLVFLSPATTPTARGQGS